MAPGILLAASEDEERRPSKRRKHSDANEVAKEQPVAVPVHPLGVKPLGNSYTASANSKTKTGVFARLPDELVALLLESLKARDLRLLGASCKALYAFTRAEELWKALFIEYVKLSVFIF